MSQVSTHNSQHSLASSRVSFSTSKPCGSMTVAWQSLFHAHASHDVTSLYRLATVKTRHTSSHNPCQPLLGPRRLVRALRTLYHGAPEAAPCMLPAICSPHGARAAGVLLCSGAPLEPGAGALLCRLWRIASSCSGVPGGLEGCAVLDEVLGVVRGGRFFSSGFSLGIGIHVPVCLSQTIPLGARPGGRL